MSDKEQIKALEKEIGHAKVQAALEHLEKIEQEIQEYLKANPQLQSIEDLPEN